MLLVVKICAGVKVYPVLGQRVTLTLEVPNNALEATGRTLLTSWIAIVMMLTRVRPSLLGRQRQGRLVVSVEGTGSEWLVI